MRPATGENFLKIEIQKTFCLGKKIWPLWVVKLWNLFQNEEKQLLPESPFYYKINDISSYNLLLGYTSMAKVLNKYN